MPVPGASRYEYIVQGNYGYGHGWEDECTETSPEEGKKRLNEYWDNCQIGAFRLVRRLEGRARCYDTVL